MHLLWFHDLGFRSKVVIVMRHHFVTYINLFRLVLADYLGYGTSSLNEM